MNATKLGFSLSNYNRIDDIETLFWHESKSRYDLTWLKLKKK